MPHFLRSAPEGKTRIAAMRSHRIPPNLEWIHLGFLVTPSKFSAGSITTTSMHWRCGGPLVVVNCPLTLWHHPCYPAHRMKQHNPWPEGATPDRQEGDECVYADHTGLKMYAPVAKPTPTKKEKIER